MVPSVGDQIVIRGRSSFTADSPGLRCRAMSLLSEEELAVRAVSVRAGELVFVRNALEANEGVGFLIAKRGGDALLVAPRSRESELDEFIHDMQQEVGLVVRDLATLGEALDVAR